MVDLFFVSAQNNRNPNTNNRAYHGNHYTYFAVMLATGEMELHEVKGFWTDDARVKTKVAADQYPFRIIGVTVKPKKAGGGWNIEEF